MLKHLTYCCMKQFINFNANRENGSFSLICVKWTIEHETVACIKFSFFSTSVSKILSFKSSSEREPTKSM